MWSRTSGEASCPIRSCRWRGHVEVSGGDAEFRAEEQRVVEQHQRKAHPWKFVEFTELAPPADSTQRLCGWCGALIGDPEAHRQWHEQAEA
jgi:hypothetical protein